jgi:hypothetical protein
VALLEARPTSNMLQTLRPTIHAEMTENFGARYFSTAKKMEHKLRSQYQCRYCRSKQIVLSKRRKRYIQSKQKINSVLHRKYQKEFAEKCRFLFCFT